MHNKYKENSKQLYIIGTNKKLKLFTVIIYQNNYWINNKKIYV